jgi:hypothetical protein
MTTRQCGNCGRTYEARQVRGQPRKWCSAYCRRRGQGGFARDVGPPELLELTPLNIAVSARYDACAGAHVPSGEVLMRDIGGKDHILAVCAVCGVPVAQRYLLWNGKTSQKGYAA